MTKDQIKAELRRSALEDEYPAFEVADGVFLYLLREWRIQESRWKDNMHPRFFFLLVAEAL